jgi:gas vesicle protein
MIKQFLVGFAVGAGAGVLMAPRSGEATRSKLRTRGEGLLGRAASQGHPKERVAEDAGAPEASNPTPASASVPVELGQDQSVAEVLNHARKAELTSVTGIGDVTAKRIIKHRPYSSAEEAVREEVIPEETLEKVKEQLVDRNADEETAA